jgi:hypothetical protein
MYRNRALQRLRSDHIFFITIFLVRVFVFVFVAHGDDQPPPKAIGESLNENWITWAAIFYRCSHCVRVFCRSHKPHIHNLKTFWFRLLLDLYINLGQFMGTLTYRRNRNLLTALKTITNTFSTKSLVGLGLQNRLTVTSIGHCIWTSSSIAHINS